MSNKEQQQLLHEGAFHQNSPRPPVPGEEKSHFLSDWGPETSKQKLMEDAKFTKPNSPLPKRHFTLPSYSTASLGIASSSCRSSSRPSDPGSRSPPACIRWANSLHALLQDGDGVKLFRQYLEAEGKQHSDALDFWFACEGLRKQQEADKIVQLVKLIYKKYFIKSALPVPEEVRKEIGKNVKSSQCLHPPVTLFDQVQNQIEQLILRTTYPNFLKSEMYLQYVENMQSSSSSGSASSSDFSNDLSNMASGVDPLPTVHEDIELIVNPPTHVGYPSGSLSAGYHTPNVAPPPVRLTKDILLLSQKRRSVDRSKSETFASMFVYRGGTGAHAAYNSYNPVSRQDSELHSLSSHSDARTESDNISLTDSSIDGRSMGRMSRRQAAVNKEGTMNQIVIPRTQWVDKSQCQPMDPHKFACILIEKLEIIRKDRETQELLEKKLTEDDSIPINDPHIRDKFILDDENDQSILDDHVSLVFPDTPARSPGITSPYKHRQSTRRKKDGSIFSNDSGNVHDFAEGSEHKFRMVTSKSMPEYPDDRFVRGAVGRRSASKKTLADLTDSGVSVVSDAPPAINSRVQAWLMSGHNDVSMKQRNSSYKTSSATSPISNRHKKALGSRSSSVERNSVTGATQPFVGETCKVPLSVPNTLEEARRRLEDDVRARSKQRSSSSRHYPDLAQSSQSTLRKSQRGARPAAPASQPNEHVTTVVFTFCDEQFPYRTKIPGMQITLKQFKEYLPKRGNYRFFFKTICEELGNQVIQEEVSNDGDIVPLWEGKIMAQVKPVD